jgi:hypothetical protein
MDESLPHFIHGSPAGSTVALLLGLTQCASWSDTPGSTLPRNDR